jgi:hypothetical protein
MKTDVYLRHLADLSTGWEKFRTKICIENQDPRFVFNNYCPQVMPFEVMWKKYGRDDEATDNNVIGRMRIAYRITKARMQTHSRNLWHLWLLHGKWSRERASMLL